MRKAAPQSKVRWLWLLAALVLLPGILFLYARPDFLVMLSEQLWACF